MVEKSFDKIRSTCVCGVAEGTVQASFLGSAHSSHSVTLSFHLLQHSHSCASSRFSLGLSRLCQNFAHPQGKELLLGPLHVCVLFQISIVSSPVPIQYEHTCVHMYIECPEALSTSLSLMSLQDSFV